MNEYFEKYIKLRRVENISETTIKNEIHSHKQLWKFVKQDDPFKITQQDFERYSLYLVNSGYAQNTCHNAIKNLRQFYSEAVLQDWILINPMLKVPIPKRIQVLPSILSVQQMKSLITSPNIETLKGFRDRAVMELMYSTALRCSEIISVSEDMFSEDFRTIRIKGKGNKEVVLPVGKMAAHFCKYCVKRFGSNPIFLSTQRFLPIKKVCVQRIVKSYSEKLNFKNRVTPHSFRYSIATHLADQGVDIRLIQEFMRHDSIDTTSNYIRHGIRKIKEVHSNTHPRG